MSIIADTRKENHFTDGLPHFAQKLKYFAKILTQWPLPPRIFFPNFHKITKEQNVFM